MNNTIRESIKGIIASNQDLTDWVNKNKCADQILALIEWIVPPEKEENTFDEDYVNGYNQAIVDLLNKIKERQ